MDVEQVAINIVDEIERDLNDRRGLRQEWDGFDPEIRDEIRDEWRRIVKHELRSE